MEIISTDMWITFQFLLLIYDGITTSLVKIYKLKSATTFFDSPLAFLFYRFENMDLSVEMQLCLFSLPPLPDICISLLILSFGLLALS